MTATADPATTTTAPDRRGARLLAYSPLGFVAVVAAGIATFVRSDVPDTALLTPDKMETMTASWVGFWTLYAAALLVGAAGVLLVVRGLRGTLARAARTAVAGSIASVLGMLVLDLVLLGSDRPLLGDHPGYDASIWLSMIACWTGALAAGFAGLEFRRLGVVPRAGLAAAILAGAYTLVDLVVTRGALPPFTASIVWLVLGAALLRSRVASVA